MKLRSSIMACGAVVVIAAACGGGPASVSGTVGGVTVQSSDALFGVPGGSTSGTVLAITSIGAACSKVTTGTSFKGPATALSIELVQNGGAVTSPGTFPELSSAQGSTSAFAGSFDSWDASCSDTTTPISGGTVTITAVSASSLTGSFDLTLGNDHITGSFNAPNCAGLATSGTGSSCQ
jgi:hypothetical protein